MERLPLALRFLALGSLLYGFTFQTRVFAQEPHWRTDYNEARREAKEKNRPILLDFSTENCFWCNKLEMTTFRDPAARKLMNERFVLLHVDAQQNMQLTEALRIQSFPTLVLAAP